jgi:hypothetical protein
MTFAVTSEVRFNAGQAEATWVLPTGSFTGLDTVDRQALSDWLDATTGIDTVMDLTARPWNVAGAGVILGVFETDKQQASWLIVRYSDGWTLARCADGFVSDVSNNLPDLLRMIDGQRQADQRQT